MEEFAIENPAFEDENIENSDMSEKKGTTLPGKETVPRGNIISRAIETFWSKIGNFYKRYSKIISIIIWILIPTLYLAYFIGAIHYKIKYRCDDEAHVSCEWEWCRGHGFLIIMTSIIAIGIIYYQVIKRWCAKFIRQYLWKPLYSIWILLFKIRFIKTVVYLIPFLAFTVFIILDTAGSRERLKSLLGLIVLIVLGAIFSKHPGRIMWQPVIVGLYLQFTFGLITLRWEVGKQIFQCFGDKVETFLNYTTEGAVFVYGEELATNYFAFKVLPVIFFFSFIVQVLYYWGAMQWLVLKLGWFLQISMGTTVCESVNTAASIFLGQSEAPLVIKPYVKDLTKSEIHAIMTAGFATVSGSVLAAYINFGVEATHLLTASVMSAPAALCYSKLFYPETEESKTKVENIHLEKGDDTGVLDAASKGAMSAINLVAGIIANLIAFVSAVYFLDGVIGWFGELIGYNEDDPISFTSILTKVFYPLVWLMGVKSSDCRNVAKVVAIKTVVNEFVAYEQLGDMIEHNILSDRSVLIATYALCGFSNPSSIGIVIGALSSMAPERRSDISEVAFRAFISGCAVCFLTACVAGVLDSGES